MVNKIALSSLLTIALAACDSGETTVSQSQPSIGAAVHPCTEQFDYHLELNGNPVDTRISSTTLDGETIVTEEHWYPEFQTILFYRFAEGRSWCNSWNENGVSW